MTEIWNFAMGVTLCALGGWLFLHQIWNLRRATREGVIHIREFSWDYSREDDPFFFWGTVVISVGFLFFGLLAALGGGVLVLGGLGVIG